MRNLVLILSIILLLPSCRKKTESAKTQIIKNKLQRIDTLSDGFRVTNYYPDMYILDIMYKKTIRETPLKSLAFGQYFYFDGESSELILTGFYNNGIKDSIWIHTYEDYPIPKLEFYKNGIKTNYNGEISIKDHKNRIWFESVGRNSINDNKIPSGKWRLYRYDLDKIFEENYKRIKDSIEVILNIYDLKTKKSIEKRIYNIGIEEQ